VSGEARDLIDKMIVKKIDGRLSAKDILKHPWITSYYEDPLSGTIAANFANGAANQSDAALKLVNPSELLLNNHFKNGSNRDLTGNSSPIPSEGTCGTPNGSGQVVDSTMRALFNPATPPPMMLHSPKSPALGRKTFNNGTAIANLNNSNGNVAAASSPASNSGLSLNDYADSPASGVSSLAMSPSAMIDSTTVLVMGRQYRSSLLHPIIEVKDNEAEVDKIMSGVSNVDKGEPGSNNSSRRIASRRASFENGVTIEIPVAVNDGNNLEGGNQNITTKIASRRKSFENVATIEVPVDANSNAIVVALGNDTSPPNISCSNSPIANPKSPRSPRNSFLKTSPRGSSSPIFPSPKLEETKERDSFNSNNGVSIDVDDLGASSDSEQQSPALPG
jgi:serine/threonine protein kinase